MQVFQVVLLGIGYRRWGEKKTKMMGYRAEKEV